MKRKNLRIFFENVSGKNVQIHFFSVEFCLVTQLQPLNFSLADKDSQTQKIAKKFQKLENNQKILNCKLYLKNYLYLQSKKTENYFVATRNSAITY